MMKIRNRFKALHLLQLLVVHFLLLQSILNKITHIVIQIKITHKKMRKAISKEFLIMIK